MAYFFSIIALICPLLLSGQLVLEGYIADAKSKEPLAFVNIVINDNLNGTTSDIDGKFVLESNTEITQLRCSYVGYEARTITIKPGQNYVAISLTKTSYDLNEVVILPGVNPAHRIVDKVIENRKFNDPEKACSFAYTSYNKMIFTMDVDSAYLSQERRTAESDTDEIKLMELLEKQHFFLSEAVTMRKFMPPDHSNEEVLASRVSGFNTPEFSLLATQMQSFSFYDDLITVVDFTYLNPVSKGSTRKYLFVIEDTVWNNQDTVFVLSFRPRTGKNFEGLQGLLYVNTNGYALQNVLAEPVKRSDGVSVKIQQKYEHIDGQWFPVQLNTTMIFQNAQINDKAILAVGRSYLRDVKINPELRKRDFDNVVIELQPMEAIEAEKILKQYRVDSLTNKDVETYDVIDSIGKANNFDLKIKLITALSVGRLPWKFLDIELNHLLRYNEYEGLRLGFGVRTNDKISKHFSVGGYYGYGFRDKRQKWGTGLDIFLSKKREITLNAVYKHDVTETGGVSFFEDRLSDLTESYRKVFVNRMEWGTTLGGSLSFRALQHFKTYVFAFQEERNTPASANYLFSQPWSDGTYATNVYNFTTAGISVRFGFKEKFAQTGFTRISLGSKYPIVWAKVTKGFDDLYSGQFDFMRYDIKLEKTFKTRTLGSPTFRVTAGYIDGDLPWTMLYNGRGTFKMWSVSVLNSFETMRLNEFMSDRYVSLFFNHDFGQLLYQSDKFNPEFMLVTNVGFGTLSNSSSHQVDDLKTLDEGFFESGLIINNIIKSGITGLGLGGFYRYGPNALEDPLDNIAVKISVGFTF
jgi:hypothetical protein